MSKIILGIHGLGNKPPKKALRKWWANSIRDGLRSIGRDAFAFRFDLIYWADLLHDLPLDPKEKDESHPLYIKDPYTPASDFSRKKQSKLRLKVLNALERQLERLFFNEDLSINITATTDLILRKYFTDLDAYFSPGLLPKWGKPAKEVIRARLEKSLKKHNRKEIFLIAHSMGSIIAYDVLTEDNGLRVDTLVTIGSPLGIPIVIKKMLTGHGVDHRPLRKLRTPESVRRHWYNLSDLDDKVAVNYALSDDCEGNSQGIKVIDKIVSNHYKNNGNKNPHKSYGYLQTPEMAEILSDFLIRDRTSFSISLENALYRAVQSVAKRINGILPSSKCW